MATVERQTRSVEVTITEEREVVVLTLSSEEAQVLVDVYAVLGGDPDLSNRRHTSQVYEALRAAGFRYRSLGSGLGGQAMTFRDGL
jgi:hypothetical protein